MQTKNMSVAALVCGILSIVCFFVFTYLAPVLGIVAIVLGAKAQKAAKVAGEPSGMATAGLVTGIIGLAFFVLLIACVVCFAGALVASFPELAEFADLLQ